MHRPQHLSLITSDSVDPAANTEPIHGCPHGRPIDDCQRCDAISGALLHLDGAQQRVGESAATYIVRMERLAVRRLLIPPTNAGYGDVD